MLYTSMTRTQYNTTFKMLFLTVTLFELPFFGLEIIRRHFGMDLRK